MKRFETHAMIGATLFALLVTMPAAAQNEDAGESAQAMMQSRMAQNMQRCMMMMQSMHGAMMMNQMPGMMRDSARVDAVKGGMLGRPGMMGIMGGQGMMGGRRMMGGPGMMGEQNTLHRSMMLVHVLPSMQEPLDLSEAQITQLTEAEESLMEAHAQLRDSMTALQERLRDLMAQENADPDDVETLMKRIAEQRAEIQSATFAASQDMKEMLTVEQRAALEDMDAPRLLQHMMQNMSMMEMMQMMQKMQGYPPGASGGMMQPGSMPQNDVSPSQHQQHHK